MRRLLPALAFGLWVTACGGHPTQPSPSPTPVPGPAPTPPPAAGLELAIAGDPESNQGATWTCRGVVNGSAVNLQGVLLKPAGAGPFPAVVISHGAGGNAGQYSTGLGREMRRWGLVAIATNYTHAGNVPIGAPGTIAEPGASRANVIRAHSTVLILGKLGYVDLRRVAAHGHSMGAFVTTGFAAAHPEEIRVASHTAGGVRPDTIEIVAAAPSDSEGRGIRMPYQWHHGDQDIVVPLLIDLRLDDALRLGGAPHEGHVYAGDGHADLAQHPRMLERVRAWYAAQGLL